MLYWDKLLRPKRRRMASTETRSTNDNRSPYKKDFDTICNSPTLRRLQDKAQIFPLEEDDHCRTRLTHSIEVMSIAESLGMMAVSVIKEDNNSRFIISPESSISREVVLERINNIPIILKSVSLLHDMGNPPFGHLGESIINKWFEKNLRRIRKIDDGVLRRYEVTEGIGGLNFSHEQICDLNHFDGNAQLLRVVSKLDFAVDSNGMNLTYPVIASFIKYPCSSTDVNKDYLSKKKAGYFLSEKNLFLDVVDSLGLMINSGYCRHPLAFLLEAADDIAYLTADIEDAVYKRIISLDQIYNYLLEEEGDPLIQEILEAFRTYQNEATKLDVPNKKRYIMHRLRIHMKGKMLDSMSEAFSLFYTDIMEGKFENELLSCSDASKLEEVLRKIEKKHIHYCREIVENKTRAIVILNKILDKYVPAILSYDALQDEGEDTEANLIRLSLSDNFKHVCSLECKGKSEIDQVYYKLRLITDQISGMTDTHALKIYKMLAAT